MKRSAKELRKNSTDAEKCLWYHIRNRQLAGFKVRRQHIIPPFIVDFVCIEKKLIIEVDGGQHAENLESDTERSEFLKNQGYRILRFWDHEVLQNGNSVLQVILSNLEIANPSPQPSPLKGWEREI